MQGSGLKGGKVIRERLSGSNPAVSAVLIGFLTVGYRVSVWTHTKTPPRLQILSVSDTGFRYRSPPPVDG